MLDQEDPPPFSSFFGEVDDGGDYESAGNVRARDAESPRVQLDTIDETDLRAVTRRIGDELPHLAAPPPPPAAAAPPPAAAPGDAPAAAPAVAELQYRTGLIGRHMGSLALCRGRRGDTLHEAGAVAATLSLLAGLNRDVLLLHGAWADDAVRLPTIPAIVSGDGGKHSPSCESNNEVVIWSALDQATVALASACIGGIRDMACGNASNRAAISEYRTGIIHIISNDERTAVTGPQILASYVKRYHKISWEDILGLEGGSGRDGRGKRELRLFTDVCGAIRNASHSTPTTCAILHSASVTKMFLWRILQGSKDDSPENVPTLPDASRPWREASFRIAGSLINISERCSGCAKLCGSDLDLIRLLVEAWGGAGTKAAGPKGKTKQTTASTPMLHLGLAAILHAADAISPLDESLRSILDKEDARKDFARKKEAERQKRLAQGLK